MPTPPFIFRGALCAVLSVACISPVRADVLVVTDSRHPVQNAANARIVELDLPLRIEADLSAHLPSDPGEATVLARQRVAQASAEWLQQLSTAYQGVADAWALGIATIPAVVVDRRYVIYGEPDAARALTRIENYRRGQP